MAMLAVEPKVAAAVQAPPTVHAAPAPPDQVELYKKYRPKKLSEVVGCKAAVEQLRGFGINRMPHALLFSGPSGCGKTTIARIIAHGLKATGPDVVELNSASFRGIDMVRELREKQGLSPMQSPCRCIIIDEAHQLTAPAQDAILKLLEDTPAHVYYMVATTDPGKLKAAIRTRCTEITVQALTDQEALGLLQRVIAAEEMPEVDLQVLDKLVECAGGSARKLLVTLDQVRGVQGVAAQLQVVERVAGTTGAFQLAQAIAKGAPWATVGKLLKACEDDPETIRRVVAGYLSTIALGAAEPGVTVQMLAQFTNNWYDMGTSKAAAVVACYRAIAIKQGKG